MRSDYPVDEKPDEKVGIITEIGEIDSTNEDIIASQGLARTLTARHLVMISIGTSIGMGLWLGAGTSLRSGGPAGIFLGYVLASSVAWTLNQAIGEIAILYPVPSPFAQWSVKFIDPAWASTLCFTYWFSYSVTMANELQGCATVMKFWTHKVPTAGWLSIFLVVIVLINCMPVIVFGEVEMVMSTIKFLWIFVVIIACIIMAVQQHIGFHYWRTNPFPHGFKGFLSVMSTCIFAMVGSELTGLVAPEAKNPRRAVPPAVNSIWLRLGLFYIIGSLMVTISVRPDDPNLFGGTGTNASPFVISYRNGGLPGLAHAMNAIILLSTVSSGSAQAYGGSRQLIGMSQMGMAPKFLGKVDRAGRPWPGLILTFAVGGGLCYLNVSQSGATVFEWFSSLCSLSVLFVWATIFICHLRFRFAWKHQGRELSELPWKSYLGIWGSIYGLTICILLYISQFYLSIWPLGGKTTARNFFATYISVVLIVVWYVCAKIYYRGPFYVKLDKVDLDKGRMYYKDEDSEKRHFSLNPKKVGTAMVDFVRGED